MPAAPRQRSTAPVPDVSGVISAVRPTFRFTVAELNIAHMVVVSAATTAPHAALTWWAAQFRRHASRPVR